MNEKEITFAADRMLGRLAKWLRVLGCDVIYGRHLSGQGLIRAARAEDRLILTRDRALGRKAPPSLLFIDGDDYLEQLRQVMGACDLRPGAALFSRCLECNLRLEARDKDFAEKLAPPQVLATQDRFSWCGRCQKLYWPATHQRRMADLLGKIAPP